MDWQKFYWQTDGWASKLALYKDELKSLQNLLDRYFEEMAQCLNLDELREEVMRFQDVRYRCEKLIKKTRQHRQNLALAMDQAYTGYLNLGEEHSKLHKSFENFAIQLKTTKNEILLVTDIFLEEHQEEAAYLS